MASTMKRSSDMSSSRGSARRRGPGGRADRDGDISMDSRPRNNNNRVGKSSARGGGNRPSLGRKGLNLNALEDEVDMQGSSGASASANVRSRPRAHESRPEYMKIRVTGWKNSKASSNEDKGVGALVSFLQNKTRINRQKAAKAGRITGRVDVTLDKWYKENDDSLVFSVPTDIGGSMLRMDGWSFSGANISIKKFDKQRSPTPEQEDNVAKLRATLTSLLDRRYNAESKLLDLSSLGLDPDLKALGVFDMGSSTAAKVFPAIMKHCDTLFKTAQEKREKFDAITLHSNELASLDNIKTLAFTFPDLKNLDLSNNKFAKLEDLRPWKNRFRKLDHLVLTNNPIEQVPDYHVEILKWYPSLRFLNAVQVRSDVEAAQATASQKKGLPVKPRAMLGDEDITNNFVSAFFPGFDADRNALVAAYYDQTSQFSFAVNSHALRDASSTATLTKQEWESYIRKSRNLKVITHLPARQSRLFIGQDQIREAFATIPVTRHAAEPDKVHIESQSLPVVPDGTGQYPQGVVGLLITVHGEYEEMDVSTGQATKRRSYDRSITLGPGLTGTGLRVINDMLTVRAYGGSAAFQPEQTMTEQDVLVLEFSKHTGMTVDYSRMCLEQSAWDPNAALATFESAKATLPAEAFITPA
ncbi:mRNA export factor mex67 [Lasiodiplodia theobromae]|uniref:mRNA export factor MEX67 n=1 Tax=Lasiodiplodia theobromae TaxID=45133 RepID=A0A5N5D8J7_9PEZI|nr:mRNA export factor mex67 [Lasiodiplodia theobromae]KAB2573971.1 mRNA export factor MEX67 [Lasiodiplodia theobromae]KAF4538260.1 mRNA export factor mex67 [Lasiodiplodia theobromae]